MRSAKFLLKLMTCGSCAPLMNDHAIPRTSCSPLFIIINEQSLPLASCRRAPNRIVPRRPLTRMQAANLSKLKPVSARRTVLAYQQDGETGRRAASLTHSLTFR